MFFFIFIRSPRFLLPFRVCTLSSSILFLHCILLICRRLLLSCFLSSSPSCVLSLRRLLIIVIFFFVVFLFLFIVVFFNRHHNNQHFYHYLAELRPSAVDGQRKKLWTNINTLIWIQIHIYNLLLPNAVNILNSMTTGICNGNFDGFISESIFLAIC